MPWNIAQAKQQFSEVLRLTAQEPQAIYNREKPVAVLVNPDDYAAFAQWRSRQRATSLLDQFSAARAAMAEADLSEIALANRQSIERPNAFVQMLTEEGLHAAG